MPAILAKQGAPFLLRRKTISSRWRRAILFTLMIGAIMSALMLTSKQVGRICHGSSCGFSSLRGLLAKCKHGPASSPQNDNIADSALVGHETSISASNLSLSKDNDCNEFPDTSKVLILIKTGASEAYSKLPVHLLTTLKCLSHNFLLFSDMAENIAGYTVHDSLETVLSTVKGTNGDFDIYHRQNDCPIAHEQCNEDHDVGFEGWNLDKYKNVHIAEQAYKMRPDYDWYFFIDADTYVSFPTLMEWLPTVDPNKLHYIGHEKYSGSFPFAHGGSGYLMSKASMRHMFFGKTGVGNKYDEATQDGCCGDIMWSEIVLNETGLTPENMWPVINEFKPRTFNYYEDQWCQPLITLHHVNGEEINDLYAFERGQNFAKRIRIKDMYYRFVATHLVESRSDWDNGGEDVYYLDREARTYEASELDKAKTDELSDMELVAHKNSSSCKDVCYSQEDCFQWRYRDGICGLAYNKMRLGNAVKKDDDEAKRSFSGWHMDRINKWIGEQGNCSETYQWRVMDEQRNRDSGT
ncbi:fringe-like glycosyl transferase family protein [Metarhizium robertsii]|uniref:N-acetylgalactosaminide beta-1,3-galactosyltransferase n=2 Tax=Metarhizium robertsii TaxID=568076 RepID=E9F8P6_METRA|nr:glycosyltransferase family 31 protein [Metarhizium robertsii ARSEF 23]EFY95837.1 glycosyltransferase family 31 protein [Metarhizium robertsii ARSEF 23]EXU97250.1 fringe-like glycosyl transferase family protein [Metarhizium robertsii]